jgi:hypothetical protein
MLQYQKSQLEYQQQLEKTKELAKQRQEQVNQVNDTIIVQVD